MAQAAEASGSGQLREVELERSLRATPDVAPPPTYKSHPHPYRALHMRPKQTAAYVENQVALAEHKIVSTAPSFRTAPPANVDARLAYHHPTASPIKFAIIGVNSDEVP